ncbi:ATPase [Sulfuriferula sp. AH1]|uniref:cation-translocating P-type ATPase n=1 Tax=Sulfuriferula sp. AH1 TaxID=1985873 RepID=UPI000B3B62BC|nr:cation-transporting P-type ATPase [Sulfuriferula sp. AH1]ARU31163.1 ATPase [Sulfuriferula sp. AH1]
MKIHQLPPLDAIASLKSSEDGLSQAEAGRRLHEFGLNQVEAIAHEHLVLRFLKNFTHFFAIILLLAAVLAFVAEWHDPGQDMATLGFAILGVIVVNGLFSFWQEFRAEKTLVALRKLLPQQVKVMRDGALVQLLAEQLVPGDIVVLAQGDNVPADCRLIEAFGVKVNTATITGESLAKSRQAEASGEEMLFRSKNVLLAGTSLVSGEARALVFATGMRTEFGKIAHLTQTAEITLSPLQLEIARLSRFVALLATLIGVVFFVIGEAIGFTFWQNFIFAIGIIVANVPEGLLPTVTLALAMATQRMARRHALVRHLPSVETLGAVTVICTDKTGTLTRNRMMVKSVFLANAAYAPDVLQQQTELTAHYRHFLLTASLCQDLQETVQRGKSTWLGDPMEIALMEMSHSVMPEQPHYLRIDEIPFDTDRMRISTLHQTPDGLMLYCKGAPEMVLPLCQSILLADGVAPLTPELKAGLIEHQNKMAEAGLRILAFAYREVSSGYGDVKQLEQNLVFSGLVGLEDPPRPEVAAAIQKCEAAGIKVIMITGDHPFTAAAIAREIGLVQTEHPVILTGDMVSRLSTTQLQLTLDAPEIIFARVRADQKMRIVNILKQKQHIVAVTGDGVNDAPALKSAHIGIAMGIAGTDVAKASADMILLDDNFASIVSAIEEGRAVFDNIRKFLTYILTSNIPELIPYLAFALFKIPLPLTIIQILAVDLGTDLMPALGLGVEQPSPGVMQRPPRARQDRLINWPLLMRAYLFLGLLEATAAMAAFFFVLHLAGWQYGQDLAHNDPLYLQATTACLSAIIVMQVMNVFLCRSSRLSIFTTGLGGNRLLLWGVALEMLLILLIDYTPWGHDVFGTAPIALRVWLFILPFALGMLLLEELRKRVVRKFYRQA